MDNELLNWGLRIRPSFKIVASVVPKKTVTHTKKKHYKIKELWTDQSQYSPTFSKGGYNKKY